MQKREKGPAPGHVEQYHVRQNVRRIEFGDQGERAVEYHDPAKWRALMVCGLAGLAGVFVLSATALALRGWLAPLPRPEGEPAAPPAAEAASSDELEADARAGFHACDLGDRCGVR